MTAGRPDGTARVSVPPLAETVAAFDLRAPTYDRSRMHQVVAAEVVVAAEPQPGQVMLDIAGGTGLVARASLPHLAGAGSQGHGAAVVLDASPGMLQEARRCEPRLLLVRADAHRLPFRDHSVDLVSCVTALHLFTHPEQVLREGARACRPGGRLVFTTFAESGWSSGRLFREAAAQEGVVVPDPATATGTPEAAAALAERAGLDVEGVREVRCREPLEDREAAWQRVATSSSARASAGATTPAIRARFEAMLGEEVEHVLLLVTCRPQRSSPSR